MIGVGAVRRTYGRFRQQATRAILSVEMGIVRYQVDDWWVPRADRCAGLAQFRGVPGFRARIAVHFGPRPIAVPSPVWSPCFGISRSPKRERAAQPLRPMLPSGPDGRALRPPPLFPPQESQAPVDHPSDVHGPVSSL